LEILNAAKQIREAEKEKNRKSAFEEVPTVCTTVTENQAVLEESKTEGNPQRVN